MTKARVLFALLSIAASARAEERFVSARLDWQRAQGAEQCVDRAELQRAVSARLGRDAFVSDGADVTVRGRIAPAESGQGWRAEIALVSARGTPIGTRVLATEAEHCSALDESLPLVLALMIDVPEDELERAEAEHAAARPEPPKQPSTPSTPLALPRDVHAPRAPWRVRPTAFAASALGLLPGVAFGAGLGVGLTPPDFWSFELDAIYWLPAQADASSQGRGRFRHASIGLYVCPIEFGGSRLGAHLCAGQRVGRIDADGLEFRQSYERARLTYALGLRARGGWLLAGPLFIGLGIGAEAPLARDEFVYRAEDGRQTELFRMAPVVLTGDVGVGLSLP